MDIDAFVASNQAAWLRLQQLTKRARRIRSLSPDEVDELTKLYETCGAHLAHARVRYAGDTMLINRLTLLVGDTHSVLYGQRTPEVRRAVTEFAAVSFPAAVVSLRRFILAASLLTFVPWAVFQVWLSVSPRAFDLIAPEAAREAYINQDFASYYSSQPAQNFATQVFLNNVRVAFVAFAAGILVCVVTAGVLAYNGANGGIAGGMFTHVGQGGTFWGLILPHGLLELSAVVVAGAAGLRIGWTLIDPGDHPRLTALADESRRAGNVLVGLIAAFLLAAVVEGFVTGRPWPTAVRVGIGVVVFAAFWGWTIAYGVRARDDFDETDLGGVAGLRAGRTP
ncbi:MAG: stage II sporulation protein M [Actinomycetota bacterium]